MTTSIIKTSARVGLASLLVCATNAVAASTCTGGATEPIVKLEPSLATIDYQLGDVPPSPAIFNLSYVFQDGYTRLVNIKRSGGIIFPFNQLQSLQNRSCPTPMFEPSGSAAELGQPSCQLQFKLDPQIIGNTPGDYEGTISVTYNLQPVEFNKPGCTGTGEATATVRVAIAPPFGALSLSSGAGLNPIRATVGETKAGLLRIYADPNITSKYHDVTFRAHISMEPSVHSADFTFDPAELQVAGIGASPEFITYHGVAENYIKVIFKPSWNPAGAIIAKGSGDYYQYYAKVALTSKVCRKR